MPRFLKQNGQSVYIDGFHLLALCQKLVRETQEAPPNGSGTADVPYVMTTPSNWIARWRASNREAEKYYKLAGRLILKNRILYVSDIGPAYLKGIDRINSVDKAKARYLKDTRSTDGPILPVANFNDTAKEKWLKQNTMKDPTYRSGAQKIVDPGLIYEDSARTVEQMGGGRPTSWREIRYSPIIAKAIRTLLRGDKLELVNSDGKYDRDYSRIQSMLPVFTMAIFHSEPARNERAWPINLMLLDLAEAQTANFTWDAILWHPEAINPVPGQVTVHVVGPMGRTSAERTIVNIGDKDKLHLVGGILPASPTAGGERGKPSLYESPTPLSPAAMAHGAVQKQGVFLKNIPFDYIHQKEIDVLLKWLLRFTDVRQHWSPFDGDTVPETQVITSRHQ